MRSRVRIGDYCRPRCRGVGVCTLRAGCEWARQFVCRRRGRFRGRNDGLVESCRHGLAARRQAHRGRRCVHRPLDQILRSRQRRGGGPSARRYRGRCGQLGTFAQRLLRHGYRAQLEFRFRHQRPVRPEDGVRPDVARSLPRDQGGSEDGELQSFGLLSPQRRLEHRWRRQLHARRDRSGFRGQPGTSGSTEPYERGWRRMGFQPRPAGQVGPANPFRRSLSLLSRFQVGR